MPNMIANKNKADISVGSDGSSSTTDGYWDCSKRDKAVNYAQLVYDNAVENYEEVYGFSRDVDEEIGKVSEVVQLYDNIYSLINSNAESLLTEVNVNSLNVGLSCLNNYKMVLDDINSQARLASVKCYEDMRDASAALAKAKTIECEWVRKS